MVPAAGTVPAVTGEQLSETDQTVLDIERAFYRVPGSKQPRIRDELDLSETRYYQLLNALLDNPAALAAEPVLIGRLRRIRDARKPPDDE